MASKIFPPYTTTEAQNLALGQAGAFYVNDQNVVSVDSGVIIAITIIDAATFTALTSENDHQGNDAWPNTTAAAYINGAQEGTAVGSSDSFPAGVTIYGRWTGFDLAGGKVIAYIGS